jgi:hypothetical protein
MDHILALTAVILQAIGILGGLAWYLLKGAKSSGSSESSFETRLQHLKEDDEELRSAIAANKIMQENDYRELRNLHDRLLEHVRRVRT